MPTLLNAKDYREAARRTLPKALFDYIDRGTEDENALRGLRRSLDAVRLVPSMLTGHPARDLSVEVFGTRNAMPVIVAPTALAGLVAHNGEVKLARAAQKAGIPICISTQSVTTVEEIRDGAPDAQMWFQLYMWKDRALTRALLERVEKVGVDTLVVTADTPAGPKREYNQRNGFGIPLKMSPRLCLDLALHPRWLLGVMARYLTTTGMPTYGHYPAEFRSSVTRANLGERVKLENLLNWEDVRELRRWWKGKLVIKGILSVEDAARARELGADGIVVSSHGARNVDVIAAPIEVLPRIADAHGQALQILADSGVSRGTDVLKYVASGASAVMMGRLPLWGLAAADEHGADALLSMMRDEIDLSLTMLGRKRPQDCAIFT